MALLFGVLLIPKYKASSSVQASPLNAPTPRHLLQLRRGRRICRRGTSGAPDAIPNVWLVDQTRDFETYSNGLRIDDRYVKPNQKRIFYPVYQRGAIDAATARVAI